MPQIDTAADDGTDKDARDGGADRRATPGAGTTSSDRLTIGVIVAARSQVRTMQFYPVRTTPSLHPRTCAGRTAAVPASPAARRRQMRGDHTNVVPGGEIELLDGRNRLAASEIASVEPRSQQYKGDSPVAFIIGANLLRRHLNPSQKAALGVDVEPHFAKEAKERQREHGGTAPGKRKNTSRQVAPSVPEKSYDKAAKAVGASGRSVSRAKKVKAKSPKRFAKTPDTGSFVGSAGTASAGGLRGCGLEVLIAGLGEHLWPRGHKCCCQRWVGGMRAYRHYGDRAFDARKFISARNDPGFCKPYGG